MPCPVTQEEVLAGRDQLPPLPKVIAEILRTLEDPDANLNMLVTHVGRDPVIAARVFATANVAASYTRHQSKVRDLYTATSLIGLTRLRETVIAASLAGFIDGMTPPSLKPGFWAHSAAAGVAAQQLAIHLHHPPDAALIAGLLHDIGQLWLVHHYPQEFLAAMAEAATRTSTIEAAERARFGVDHARIGGWLTESWGLPKPICDAVRHHHAPDAAATDDLLVPLVHVAEVLSNALDLSGNDTARVAYLSPKSCQRLGLRWDAHADSLFGRIDSIGRFVAAYFRPEN